MPPSPPLVGLTIAGTDPTGGAGIAVDMQVFRDHGLHPMAAVTAILAQNSQGVRLLEPLEGRVLRAQLEAIADDRLPDVIKIGLLPGAASVAEVASWLRGLGEQAPPVVLDPVMASGVDGRALVEPDLVEALLELLAPHVDVWTPNVPEARILSGVDDESVRPHVLAGALGKLGGAVLLKMGHSEVGAHISDLWVERSRVSTLDALATIDDDVRGTGCQLASALAAGLARGLRPREAAEGARRYLSALLHGSRYRLGKGRAQILRLQEQQR